METSPRRWPLCETEEMSNKITVCRFPPKNSLNLLVVGFGLQILRIDHFRLVAYGLFGIATKIDMTPAAAALLENRHRLKRLYETDKLNTYHPVALHISLSVRVYRCVAPL